MTFSWPIKPRWRAFGFAAAFELGLWLSMAMAAAAAYAITEPAARDTSISPQARMDAQIALEGAIRRAAPHDALRLRDFLISAIEAGEMELARGVMLSHGDGSLPEAQRLARFTNALPLASAQALDIAQTEASARVGPRSAALVITPDDQSSGVHTYPVESLRALAAQAELWRTGQPVDEFSLMLTGLDLATAQAPDAIQLLKIARRAGRLNPAYERHWRTLLAQAVPAARLRQALLQAQAGAVEQPVPVLIPEAFRQALDPRGAQALAQELEALGAIQRAAGTPGALILIALIHAPRDSPRLRLAAVSGGDRATALALLSGREALLRTVPGRLVITPHLRAILAALWASLALMAIGGMGSMACELGRKRRRDPEAMLSPLPSAQGAIRL